MQTSDPSTVRRIMMELYIHVTEVCMQRARKGREAFIVFKFQAAYKGGREAFQIKKGWAFQAVGKAGKKCMKA